FDTEATAFRRFPQIVTAFKNELQKFRTLGITPVAAAGQFGIPTGDVNANGANAGDFNGMALPAVLNEVVSVTGSYPFPFTATQDTAPNAPSPGVLGRPLGPVLVTTQTGVTGTGADILGNAAPLAVGDGVIFKDKLLVSSNRSYLTDFTAPELDLPTFQR